MNWGVDGLTVSYGAKPALIDVSVDCVPGEILAVVGGDGAGKSTLLRALADIGAPSTGTRRLPPPGHTGYVPAQGGVFEDLSINEHLDFVSAAYDLSAWEDRARDLLVRTDLEPFGTRLAGNLSGGQRRKLAAAMALLPQPELLILDEVTTGVDPVSRMGLWRLIAGAAAEGAAVVFATSYLDEAERATTVALLHRGRILTQGPPGAITSTVPGTVTDGATPGGTGIAWRRGRTWRRWDPDGTATATATITLEDAAIVAELQAEAGSR